MFKTWVKIALYLAYECVIGLFFLELHPKNCFCIFFPPKKFMFTSTCGGLAAVSVFLAKVKFRVYIVSI